MGDRTISVAVTPDGFADAVTKDEDGKSWFVEPCVEQMTMEEFMCKLEDRESFLFCLDYPTFVFSVENKSE